MTFLTHSPSHEIFHRGLFYAKRTTLRPEQKSSYPASSSLPLFAPPILFASRSPASPPALPCSSSNTRCVAPYCAALASCERTSCLHITDRRFTCPELIFLNEFTFSPHTPLDLQPIFALSVFSQGSIATPPPVMDLTPTRLTIPSVRYIPDAPSHIQAICRLLFLHA